MINAPKWVFQNRQRAREPSSARCSTELEPLSHAARGFNPARTSPSTAHSWAKEPHESQGHTPLHHHLVPGGPDYGRVMTKCIMNTTSWRELQQIVKLDGQHLNAVHVSALVCHLAKVADAPDPLASSHGTSSTSRSSSSSSSSGGDGRQAEGGSSREAADSVRDDEARRQSGASASTSAPSRDDGNRRGSQHSHSATLRHDLSGAVVGTAAPAAAAAATSGAAAAATSGASSGCSRTSLSSSGVVAAGGGSGRGLALCRFFGDVSQLVAAKLDAFDARGLANILWAVARLGYVPSDTFLNKLLFEVYIKLLHLRPQELANVGWALATMHLRPSPPWVSKYVTAATSAVGAMRPQELANLCWALAALGAAPAPAPLLATATATALRTMRSFKSMELVMFVRALQQLSAGGPPVNGASSTSSTTRESHLAPPIALGKSAIGGARRIIISPASSPASSAAGQNAADVTRRRSSSRWSAPPPGSSSSSGSGSSDALFLQLVRAGARHLSEHAAELNAQDHSNWLLVLSRLPRKAQQQYVPPGHLATLTSASRLRLHEATTQGLSNMVWAVATMAGLATPDPLWLRTALRCFWAKMPSASGQSLANVAWALVRLRVRPPRRWFEAFAMEAARKLPSMNAQEVAAVAWALPQLAQQNMNGQAGPGVIPVGGLVGCSGLAGRRWWDSVIVEAAGRLSTFSTREFVMVLQGVGHAHGDASSSRPPSSLPHVPQPRSAAQEATTAAEAVLLTDMLDAIGTGRLRGASGRELAVSASVAARLVAKRRPASLSREDEDAFGFSEADVFGLDSVSGRHGLTGHHDDSVEARGASAEDGCTHAVSHDHQTGGSSSSTTDAAVSSTGVSLAGDGSSRDAAGSSPSPLDNCKSAFAGTGSVADLCSNDRPRIHDGSSSSGRGSSSSNSSSSSTSSSEISSIPGGQIVHDPGGPSVSSAQPALSLSSCISPIQLPAGWLPAFEEAVVLQLHSLTGPDAAVLLAGLVDLRLQPSTDVLQGLLSHVVERQYELAPRDVVAVAKALGKLRFRPPPSVTEALLSASSASFKDFTPRELATLAWSLGRLSFMAPVAWLRRLQHVAWPQLMAFDVMQLSRLFWGLVRMRAPLKPWFYTGLLRATRAKLHSAMPGVVTTLVWCNLHVQPHHVRLRRARKWVAFAGRHAVRPRLHVFSDSQREVLLRAAVHFQLRWTLRNMQREWCARRRAQQQQQQQEVGLWRGEPQAAIRDDVTDTVGDSMSSRTARRTIGGMRQPGGTEGRASSRMKQHDGTEGGTTGGTRQYGRTEGETTGGTRQYSGTEGEAMDGARQPGGTWGGPRRCVDACDVDWATLVYRPTVQRWHRWRRKLRGDGGQRLGEGGDLGMPDQ